jgi:hypothetical protein
VTASEAAGTGVDATCGNVGTLELLLEAAIVYTKLRLMPVNECVEQLGLDVHVITGTSPRLAELEAK